jgi:hypothetical protein
MNFLQKQNFLRTMQMQNLDDSVIQQAWETECTYRRSHRYDTWHTDAFSVNPNMND